MKLKAALKGIAALILTLAWGAEAQSRPLAQRSSTVVSGPINYVATGGSFRVDSGNSAQPCAFKNTAAGPTTGFVVTNGAVSPARTSGDTVPAGATVRAAYLYWSASAGETGFNSNAALVDTGVRFFVDGTAVPTSDNVTAAASWSGSAPLSATVNGFGMGAFADVTAIVRNNPNARFRMDGLTVFNADGSRTCATAVAYGNWALYIVYEQAGESTKTFALYDGLVSVGGTSGQNTLSTTLSGLRVPNAEPGTEKVAKVTVYVSDGDPATSTSNDTLFVSTDLNPEFQVFNNLNPANDIFNGSISVGPANGGTATGTTAANVVGGLDLDTFDVSSQVSGGTNSLNARIDAAAGERLIVHNMALMATSTAADLSITKTGPATQSGPGQLTYTLTARNSGPNEAYGVTISDPLPVGMTHVSSSDGGTYNASTRTVTWSLGRVNSGETRTRTVTVSVTGDAAVFTNTATVSSGSFDPNAANNSASVTTTVTPRADLAVTKTNGVSSVLAGGTTTYTVRVINLGPNAVSGAGLTDTPGAGLAIVGVGCTSAAGNTCTTGPGGFAITLPTLASGAFYEVNVTAQVTATGGSVTNTATVALPAGVTDPNPGNNTATDTDTVTPVADLALTKVATRGAVRPGETVEFTVRVANAGPSPVSGATLSDPVPAGLTGVTWTCVGSGGASCAAASGSGAANVDVNLPASPDTAFVILTVRGTAPSAATLEADPNLRTIRNVATVTPPAGTTDPNAGNNSATADVLTVFTTLDKGVRNLGPAGTLTPAWGTAASGVPGDVLEYCIDFANLGGAPLPDYRVVDVVPFHTALVPGSASVRSGDRTAPGAPLPGVTVEVTPATDPEGRPTVRLVSSAFALAPGGRGTVCFRARIR